MISITRYKIDKHLLEQAKLNLPVFEKRLILNKLTKSFFYDPWVIKDDFKSTIWEEILNSLTEQKGEARLIKLKPGECYPLHADIDDRYHLNITGINSYLIDLDNKKMYETTPSGYWYKMDAGLRHSAANFGSEDRIQLVVRSLLINNKINDPISISMTLKEVVEDRRFIFDKFISPWLNNAYKKGIISNFIGEDLIARFVLEKEYLEDLLNLSKDYFIITVD